MSREQMSSICSRSNLPRVPPPAMYAFAPFANDPPPPGALSFEFADSLPAQAWEAPSPALLYELPPQADSKPTLSFDAVETAWAETERMGL